MHNLVATHRVFRWTTLLLLQAAVLTGCHLAAYWLRLDMTAGALLFPAVWPNFTWALLVHLVAIELFGLTRAQWRYASISDVIAITWAMTLSAIVTFLLRDKFSPYPIPKGVILIDWALTVLALTSMRVLWRIYYVRQRQGSSSGAPRRILIVGAGDAGEAIIKQMLAHPEMNMAPVGLLDDAPHVQGLHIHRVPVLGLAADVERVAAEINATEILVAMPSITGAKMRSLLDVVSKAGLPTRTLPSVHQIISGRVSIQQIREVDITDLLGRDPVDIDETAVANLVRDKSVMVTGAGGSIGSEIARQVLRFGPSDLILVDRAEPLLFAIETELKLIRTELPKAERTVLHTCIADIDDRTRMSALMRQYRPVIVCHAAAHKHVPMMECNPGEAVKNNIFGTRSLAECAVEHGVQTFVSISTDKAVNPTSVMGATKRVAEMYVQTLAGRSKTKFITVRFGNVLNSSGSVVPIFREQIRAGGPVTVTHPDMQRYFMLIPEAVLLVLQAAAFGRGGEIFVLDMGEPIKILDMAKKMIHLSGLTPDVDIPIKFCGLRPGEKLFEELRLDGEGYLPTPHRRIRVVKCVEIGWDWLQAEMGRLQSVAQTGNAEDVRAQLKRMVPEYSPSVVLLEGAPAANENVESSSVQASR